MKFRVQNQTILCSLFMVFKPAVFHDIFIQHTSVISCQVQYFSAFVSGSICILRNVLQQAMVFRRRQNGCWISVIYAIYQSFYQTLLEKYCIKLLRIFVILGAIFGGVYVLFDLIRFFIFCIFFFFIVKLCLCLQIHTKIHYTPTVCFAHVWKQ